MNRLLSEIRTCDRRRPEPWRQRITRTPIFLLVFIIAGCAAGRGAYNRGIEAELSRDYDQALTHYEDALSEKPGDIEYRLKVQQARFAAAFHHFENGRRALEAGNLEIARAEFQRAQLLDPTNDMAETELGRVEALLRSDVPEELEEAQKFEVRKELARVDPSMDLQLSVDISGPISLRITQEAEAIYETIGELSGLNVIFDPDFRSTELSLELDDVSVYDALDIVGLQTRTFWTPINQNTIIVSPDNQQKRRDYENHILKTIYLTNSVSPTDITEAITAIRTLLNVRFIAQSTSMNAIIIRDTPDRVAIAEKIIDDIDKGKPEVLVEATVLEVDRNRLRELGILPPQGTVFGLEGDGDAATSANQVNLRNLNNLNSGSFNIVIPDSVVDFLVSDSRTRLVQNPSVRATDGQLATIRIGSRVPVASGSFQPAFVGATGTPVVQFQYIDVGVNLDITPRVLRNHEISMQVVVQVQATAGINIISGVALPVFTNREVTHQIRLTEGETNILGGLITDTESTASSGIPGLRRIPILKYLFGSETSQRDQTEIIVLLTPHIVKMPELGDRNLRGLRVGTETFTRFRGLAPRPGEEASVETEPELEPEAALSEPEASLEPVPGEDSLQFDTSALTLERGTPTRLGLRIDTSDMTGADLVIEFDPSSVTLQQVNDGGFLSGDGTSIALVQTIDTERGRAVISLERSNLASAVSGEGEVLSLVLEAVGSGESILRVDEVRIHSTGVSPRSTPAAEVRIHIP